MDELSIKDLELMLSVGGSVGKTAKAGWSINSLELGKACEFLGLDLTVMVRFTSGVNRHGTAKLQRKHKNSNVAWHVITLSQIHTKEDANETLWHELAHCWQKEQWAKDTGDSMFLFHKKAYKQHGYKNNPWEIHARGVAEQQKHWMLLA